MHRVGPDPIDLAAVLSAVRDPRAGGNALFTGTVRDTHEGKSVVGIHYEAYPEMVLKTMDEVEREARAKHAVTAIVMMHRTGRLAVGEVSVAVAVSAPHRREAIEACHLAIDALKAKAPIWKKELYRDGEAWLPGSPIPAPPGPAA